MDTVAGPACEAGSDAASCTRNFQRLTGNPPFRWQERLYQRFVGAGTDDLPTAVDLPTGLGKTSVMAIWLLARLANPGLPRRLVYVVDRRAVVDQATEYAETLRRNARALGVDDLPLSTLRGRFVDNREWLADPSRPAIIVGTIDMIGSRLLFEGYGVSRRMRPYQAGLLGVDALVVLDEAHLCPPFQALLAGIAQLDELKPKGERRRALIPAFRLLPLSATGGEAGERPFRLEPEDADPADQPVVHERLTARKRLALLPELEDKAKLDEALAEAARVLGEGGGRVIVYCDSRKVAQDVANKLAKDAPERTELMVGARRVHEREKLAARLRELGFLPPLADAPLAEPAAGAAFLVATSAGEVGVDLDADHMVCDLVAFERMAQRLGRVNRRGGEGREACVDAFFRRPEPPKADAKDDVRRRAEDAIAVFQARRAAILALPVGDDGRHDASPAALVSLKAGHADLVRQATTPEPLRPALDRAVVDAWSMTSLRDHSGRPEPEPWVRGWVDDEPQAQVLWRRWLPWRNGDAKPDKQEVERFFDVARPHASEILEAPVYEVVETLVERAKRLREQATAGTDGEGGPTSAAGTANGIIVLTPARELKLSMSFAGLAELAGKAKKRERDELLGSLAGTTVVVSAALGGLNVNGLLDEAAGEPETLGEGSFGLIEGDAVSTIGFRVLAPREASPDEDVWKEVLTFSLGGADEDEPRQLTVVASRGAGGARVGDPAVARHAQSLPEHGAWAAAAAAELADALGLDADHRRMLIFAAGAHDLGKNRDLWQDAMAASRSGRPFAKTTRRGDPSRLKIGKWTYRHEFGSLRDVEGNAELLNLPAELHELALHLIAAHHGHARPVIAPADPAEPPSVSEARARDVALRFARLQRDWGPWGTAWWEALLRAADWRASSRLDEAANGARR